MCRPTLEGSGYQFKPAEAGCEAAVFRRLDFLAGGFDPPATLPANVTPPHDHLVIPAQQQRA